MRHSEHRPLQRLLQEPDPGFGQELQAWKRQGCRSSQGPRQYWQDWRIPQQAFPQGHRLKDWAQWKAFRQLEQPRRKAQQRCRREGLRSLAPYSLRTLP